MAKAQSEPATTLSSKRCLRLLQFAEGRKLLLKSEGHELWFEEANGSKAKCRISAAALQDGISAGLFVVGAGGALVERPEAKAFLRRMAGTDAQPLIGNFAKQHQELEQVTLLEGMVAHSLTINRAASQLGTLERLKAADGSAYFARPLVLAGEKLVEDFTHGQLQPRITSRWQPRLSSASSGARNHASDLSDQALNARQRFNRAVSAIGPELSGVVVDVVCFEKGLELVERERQWPARSAKLMLRTGLEILVRHYQPQPQGPAPMRSWAEPQGFKRSGALPFRECD